MGQTISTRYIYTQREREGRREKGWRLCLRVSVAEYRTLCTLRLLPYAEKNEERESTKQL